MISTLVAILAHAVLAALSLLMATTEARPERVVTLDLELQLDAIPAQSQPTSTGGDELDHDERHRDAGGRNEARRPGRDEAGDERSRSAGRTALLGSIPPENAVSGTTEEDATPESSPLEQPLLVPPLRTRSSVEQPTLGRTSARAATSDAIRAAAAGSQAAPSRAIPRPGRRVPGRAGQQAPPRRHEAGHRARLITNLHPCDGIFPSEADGDRGTVTVALRVGPQGLATASDVVQEYPRGQGFARAARTCSSRLRFIPATDTLGRPTASLSKVRLHFERAH